MKNQGLIIFNLPPTGSSIRLQRNLYNMPAQYKYFMEFISSYLFMIFHGDTLVIFKDHNMNTISNRARLEHLLL